MKSTESTTSVFNNTLIWFGAAVSIAEIITGTYFAPLGFKTGLLAIIIGHLIGGALLFMAGLIGAKTKKSSMQTTSQSFGRIGSSFFALLNIIQLIGWTGIMIYDGTAAASEVIPISKTLIAIIIGLLIASWIFIGLTNVAKINTLTIAALFTLTIVLCKVIFFSKTGILNKETISESTSQIISFGSAIELAIAMPLSWLPLISDYTRNAEKPTKSTAASAVTYTLVSIWMYTIGMGASLFTGEEDIAKILLQAGLGSAALIIIIFSTVTTTFMDAFSSGVSLKTVFPKTNEKLSALITAVIGTILAIFLPMDDITGFLYFIGSVFAPMIAVLIADFFILHTDSSTNLINIQKLLVWLIGFVLYRILMNYDLITGCTIPTMIFTFALSLIVHKIFKR